MKVPLIVFPEAESDISQAYQWYEKMRLGLGEEFILSLEASFFSIQRHPELYPVIYQGARRAFIRRFPYGIYYTQEAEKIVVFAVFHGKRSPKKWKQRVQQHSLGKGAEQTQGGGTLPKA